MKDFPPSGRLGAKMQNITFEKYRKKKYKMKMEHRCMENIRIYPASHNE